MSVDRLTALLDEYAELERRLADPAIHADPATARRIGRRFAELTPIYKTARSSSTAGPRGPGGRPRSWPTEDSAFAAEAEELAARIPSSRSGSPSCSCRATPTTPAT